MEKLRKLKRKLEQVFDNVKNYEKIVEGNKGCRGERMWSENDRKREKTDHLVGYSNRRSDKKGRKEHEKKKYKKMCHRKKEGEGRQS